MPAGVHDFAASAAACLNAIIVIFMMFIDASMPCIIAEASQFTDCTSAAPDVLPPRVEQRRDIHASVLQKETPE